MPPHRKTCRRHDIPGDAHFLTFSCYRRLPLLDRDRSRQWFLDALRLAHSRRMFDLWAYVLMPEHVHLVLLPHDGVRIAEVLTTLKQSTSKRALNWLRENSPDYLPTLLDQQPNGSASHRFWQRGGGYDRNLRGARDIYEKVAYVHDNPVRRGFVTDPADWPWSSARAWRTGADEPVAIDRDSLPPLTILDERAGASLMTRPD